MQSRQAKNNALKAIKTSSDDHEEDVELIDSEQSDENSYTVPIYTQNAPNGLTLDLFKQYKRKVEFCDRDLMRIHDKTLNKKDKGSLDRGLIYVDFSAGMFEALKQNFLNCLKSTYDVCLIADPKIEFYGQALERVCLDLRMKINNNIHDVKIKVHNTKCSLDVAAFHTDEIWEKFPHLNNLSVGEYFAKFIVTDIVKHIDENTDITRLNEHLRYLATEGKKSARSKASSRKSCTSCDKDTKNTSNLSCTSCSEIFHISCLSRTFDDVKKLSIEKEFKCGNCLVYPERAISLSTDNNLRVLDDLKIGSIVPHSFQRADAIEHISDPESVQLAPVLSPPEPDICVVDAIAELEELSSPETYHCQTINSCNFTSNNVEDLNAHISETHEIVCNECEQIFTDPKSLADHCNQEHSKRGAKRNRPETSLLFDARICIKCDQLSQENTDLRTNTTSLNTVILENKENLEKLNKDIEERNTIIANLTDEVTRLRAEAENSTIHSDLKKRNEEFELMKQMVVERDNSIKKLQDTHQKEVNSLKLDKEALKDELDKTTVETTVLKDKESTLIDIFKYMKKHMDIQANKSTNENPTLVNCVECNASFETNDLMITHMKEHSTKVPQTKQANSTSEIEHVCDECEYTNTSEENVLNHTLAKHSKHPCDKCNHISNSVAELVSHSIDKHTNNETQHNIRCWQCNSTFSTREQLRVHISNHHKPDRISCDYCGSKVSSISSLDVHIKEFHKISQHKHQNSEISPINRQANGLSSRQKLENGYCKNWSEGHCKFDSQCRYAHVKPCQYQETCRFAEDCRFYHHSKNNISFLCGTMSKFKRSFILNQQEFPPLARRRRAL